MAQQIILNRVDLPDEKSVPDDVDFLCESTGFKKGGDSEDLALQLFETVVRNVALRRQVTSDFLASELDVQRAVVNYHLRQFISTGFFSREKHSLTLRGGSMERTILEIRKDADRMFEDMIEVARELDGMLGLARR